MIYKMNIEAIRVQLKLTRQEMAEKLGISLDRYNRLASGESKMLAVELVKIHDISEIPYENIEVLA
jgi:transcriptional regulator with XRE-family HTH domain